MFHVLAADLPSIAPSYNAPYINVLLSIVAATIGVVIIVVVVKIAIALGQSVSAMRSGVAGVGEPLKVAGMGILVIALLSALMPVIGTMVNWLHIG